MAKNYQSILIKAALFATGFSGIVAEYLLSTLASYLMGDSIYQWAMMISIMLFAMGLGSRVSKSIKSNLISSFIYIEFVLSILVSFTVIISYTFTIFNIHAGFIIYSMAVAIGLLIGMEIPVAIRINDEFETLRVNVSAIIEKDYYGSLAGGVFFAFIGIPIFGIIYTPFILGAVNFVVACILLVFIWKYIPQNKKRKYLFFSFLVAILILLGSIVAKPIIEFDEQTKYKDKIVFSKQSKYQKIIITQWQNHYWLYINGNQQLSTIDEIMYHEPLVHPVMMLHGYPQNVLVLGGGDGCAVREILKYKSIKKITLVDIDPEMTLIGKTNPIFTKLNQNALINNKVNIINTDGFKYIENDTNYYDVIIIDLPDPKTIELNRLYSYEFYYLCKKRLTKNGYIVTQAGSPYYATKAFKCIQKTLDTVGFSTLAMHNQILTLGEWGWVIGSKSPKNNLKNTAQNLKFDSIPTQWINTEAMSLMTSFGKVFFISENEIIKINKLTNPVLYQYYMKGNWDLY